MVGVGVRMADSLILICTNDMHSHADRFSGIERAIGRVRDEFKTKYPKVRGAPPVIIVDAGDWFSGTVYSWLGPSTKYESCPEIEYFARNNVIANLGNHEFDATVEGLANMMQKAFKIGYKQMVCSNIKLAKTCILNRFYSADIDSPNVLNECLVVEIEGFGNVGILGLMGEDAAYGCIATTVASGVTFSNSRETASRCQYLVRRLRSERSCRTIILLYHGGKEELLKYNFGSLFDFHVCGHTHEVYAATQLAMYSQAGAYAVSLGVHELRNDSFAMTLTASEVFVLENERGDHWSYRTSVKQVLASMGLHDDSPIAYSDLPIDAQLSLRRSSSCRFAKWVCDQIFAEARTVFKHPVHGFFVANELFRGDFTMMSKTNVITIKHVAEVIECGQSSADEPGVDIYLIKTNRRSLFLLNWAFVIGSKFVTANVLPAYSSGFFGNGTAWEHMSREVVFVATTKFMADSLVAVPSVIFDSKQVVESHKLCMSVTLFRRMKELSRSAADANL